jgi:MFS family permease
MVGNGLLGRAADVWGRKRVMQATAACLCVLTAAAMAAAHSYWLHTALRTAMGVATAGQLLSGYVMASAWMKGDVLHRACHAQYTAQSASIRWYMALRDGTMQGSLALVACKQLFCT